MDFDLSEDQKIMKKSVHDFLTKEFPKDVVRTIIESDEGYSTELWQKMADLGWLGLIFPEKYGGSEGSFLDLIILLEELGHNICPSPFFPTIVLCGLPILIAGNQEQKKEFLPKIVSGKMILTLALTETSVSYDVTSLKVKARLSNGEYVIKGTKLFVPYANVADYLLCVCRTKKLVNSEEGITILIVNAKDSAIKYIPLNTLVHDKQYEVLFDNVQVSEKNILGEIDHGYPIVKYILEKAALARCAEMIGGAQAVMDMALQYAKKRIQFGHPIGSFQAIRHYFVNMWTDIHGSRMLVYKAAWKVSKGIPADMEVAAAKARVGESYRRVTILGHQIFGGIGFTMEHDMHLYHRRSIAGDLEFGNGDLHREVVARELGL
jgi:alkylation response protein AidB-like acyl-CoA dehydrogenase